LTGYFHYSSIVKISAVAVFTVENYDSRIT